MPAHSRFPIVNNIAAKMMAAEDLHVALVAMVRGFEHFYADEHRAKQKHLLEMARKALEAAKVPKRAADLREMAHDIEEHRAGKARDVTPKPAIARTTAPKA